LRSEEIDPLLHREGTCATGDKRWQTPSLPWNTSGNRWQLVATDLAHMVAFAADRSATDCHRLQPRGFIKAPSSVVGCGYVRCARPRCREQVRKALFELVDQVVDDPTYT
jgi:hypothetical protein